MRALDNCIVCKTVALNRVEDQSIVIAVDNSLLYVEFPIGNLTSNGLNR